MALATVLHLDNHDATIDGYGPIPAEAARELANDPNNAIRKILTDPENLQGLCRNDHTRKALPGWNHQPAQRTSQPSITTPTGRTHHNEPDPAPL